MKCRTALWYLVFTGSTLSMLIMTNMNIAIVAMVHKPSTSDIPNVTICEHNNGSLYDGNKESESYDHFKLHQSLFDWNGHEQSLILGAVYWLCWATHIPGSLLATHFGAKLIFGMPNFLAAMLCFVTPMASYFRLWTLVTLRMVQGLLLGLTFPCLHVITARWIPPNERASFITAYFGGAVAVALGYPIFGWIMSERRWDEIFYISGWLGLTWSLAWYCFMHDTPQQHPRITLEEKDLIIKSLGSSVAKKPPPTPWARLLLSTQVWLNVGANFAFMCIFLLAQVYFPMYYRMVHHLEFSATAIFTGFPHLIRLLTSLTFSVFSDCLLEKEYISRTNVRKFSTGICTVGAGLLLLVLSYIKCNTNLAILATFTILAFTGLPNSGFYATMVDIAPNFCAIIFGISIMAGSLAGVFLTLYVGWMTENGHVLEQWAKIFKFVGLIGVLAGCIYIFFARAEVLEWNNPQERKKKIDLEMSNLMLNNNNNLARRKEEVPLRQES